MATSNGKKNMKYIIMAGGNYKHWEKPRHLSIIDGEELIARTIRLLKENGVKDINISSNNPIFEKFGVPILKHDNLFEAQGFKIEEGNWFNCFYPTDEPTCYIFGDVYFSDNAIKTIVETKTNDIEFFGSKPPFDRNYIKDHQEPFALKVVNTKHLKEAIEKTKELEKQGKFWRKPIMWELWSVIKGEPVQKKGDYKTEYVVINDYTCDVDWQEDVNKLKLKVEKPTKKLSIIIPYYKTFELTEKLLERLIPQLNDNVEVLLIDDGCNETRLDKYKNKIIINHLKENHGGAYACNVGINSSKGKYIGFIDSDDYVSEDYVSTLLEAINGCDEDTIFMDWQDIPTQKIYKRPNNIAPWKCIYKRTIIPFFSERVRYSFDYPFWEKLNKIKYTRYDVDKVLYFYNSGREDNLTHEKQKIIEEENKRRRENMIKLQALENFTLERFGELEDIERAGKDVKGWINKNDKFKCDKDLANYLLGENHLKRAFVKVIEVIPEKKAIVETDSMAKEIFKENKTEKSKKKKTSKK